MSDELTPSDVKKRLEAWDNLYHKLMSDELGFVLASEPDVDWTERLSYYWEFADELKHLAQDMEADLEDVEERIDKFLADLAEYDEVADPDTDET